MGASIRPTGTENAAAALRYLERRQEIGANNLANVNTDGFKAERAFARLLADGRTPEIATATDLRPGPITKTGSPFDVAIERDGFLVVQTLEGERLTRGGTLQLDTRHQLVDPSGNVLLGEDDPRGGTRGPVVIPANTAAVQIDAGGAVMADGVQVARLRCERVGAGGRLQHLGGGLFEPPATRERIDLQQRSVRQGSREESNVGSMEALVDMIAVQRAYASVQKVLSTLDATRGIATTELGKTD